MLRLILLPIAVATLVLACGRPSERAYYSLRYPVSAQRFEKPFPVTIRVKEVDVRESYRRTELVFRPDQHELRYRKGRRWSEPPQKMITALVLDHLRASGVVERVLETIGQAPPDYTLVTDVAAIEQAEIGEKRAARLAMTFRLVRFSDDAVVWSYSFDEIRPVGEGLVRATVRALSEILQVQMDKAVESLGRHFAGDDGPAPVAAAATPAADGSAEQVDEVVRPSVTSPLNDLDQVLKDDTGIPIGYGAVFVPTLSEGNQEPRVALFQDGKAKVEGTMGKRIVAAPGQYEARFGSGTVEQQIVVQVEVQEGRTTIVPPTWSSLQVDVVDEQFVPFRGTYELIRMDDREEFGLGFGADEQQGEELRVWVLQPGLYKLIKSGGTYRDRSNFATVRLEPGAKTDFVLVLSTDDDNPDDFLGAGEVDPAETAAAKAHEWQPRGVLGGSVSFIRSNTVSQAEGWQLGLAVFFDGALRWLHERHNWTTRLDIEEEEQRPSDGDFVNVKDRFFLHSIYTYAVVPWFGPYVRTTFESKLLPRDQTFEDPTTVDELDEEGNVVATYVDVDKVDLAGPFAPISLKESGGGNFHLLRRRAIELDLRVGFGVSHTLADGALTFEDNVLKPIESNHSAGPEAAVVGFARLTRFVTITTEFDGLLPVTNDGAEFTWRNQVTLRLSSFASLNYRFNAERNPNIGVDADVKTEHDVQLRFSYTLF